MDFVNRQWSYIRAQFEGMAATTKLLIGSLVVILLLVGFLAVLYAGQSTMRSVSAFIDGDPGPAVARLEARGIDVDMDGGQIKVPSNQFERAVGALAEGNLLTNDLFSVFDAMHDSPWMSNARSRQQYTKTMMQMLSGMVSEFETLNDATVVLDVPETTGFGDTFSKPTASVLVDVRGGGSLSKGTARAIANLVSGAVEDLDPSDVQIADKGGRAYPIAPESEMFPTDVLELIAAVETQRKEKLMDVLGYIQGVRIAVNVSLDPTRQESVESIQYAESQPLKKQTDSELVEKNFEAGGPAGVRPNTEMSISTGSTETSSVSDVQSTTEFADSLPTSRSTKQLAGHMADHVSVTINVPRTYFVNLYRLGNPDTEDAPDDATLQPLIDRQLDEIKEQAQPLIATRVGGQDVPGVVVAKMVYDAGVFGAPEAASPGGAVVAFMSTPWFGTATVGALALAAVGLMFMLVRKATQDEPLPTVEELAGVPDVLPADEDLIGEAQDVESTMEGLEVSEDDLKSRKIAEQIGELIKANPGEAGNLLGRWVDYDD